jgi:hypothetical protein
MAEHARRFTSKAPVGRFVALALGVLITLTGFLTPAHAFKLQVIDRARFVGQVTTLLPATGSPTSFVLLQPNVAVTVSINPQTQLTGKSAEANVEGLVRDDYVVVNARRVGGKWIATRIAYDVNPILPLRTVSGSVVRLTLDGRRVNVRLDAGGTRWITIGRLARYRLDGRLVDPAPILLKGEPVQLVVNRTIDSWIALEIDVRSVF